jgi:alpha-beta hydrolase superfamily lysophospholipase/SAM-dependent methyltransferase
MKLDIDLIWTASESGFTARDGTRLFYRAWEPRSPRQDRPPRALVFLHRGHEHSGRIAPLVEGLSMTEDWAFAYDARGHGFSPGERGDAPGFGTLVGDLDDFVRHVSQHYGISLQDMVLVANSVGAVVAATWMHDYAPPVRGVVMAAAAFKIKLYVPFAKPALRFARKFKRNLFVTSYIRSSMLTHDAAQAARYDADLLIAKSISAKILLELNDTAERVVRDAGAIDTPVLMLTAGRDFVVAEAPQRAFFDGLASPLKRYQRVPDSYHAIFYERELEPTLQLARDFIQSCYSAPVQSLSAYATADLDSRSARDYQRLRRGVTVSAIAHAAFSVQKAILARLGKLSDGMRIGLQYGFDSGASLDYVYRNQAQGSFFIGKLMDRGYLDAVGWRGIRLRKQQLQQMLEDAITSKKGMEPVRILDIAAGSGRYVLESVKRFGGRRFDIHLCDYDAGNLDRARQLAAQLNLSQHLTLREHDAFGELSYGEGFDIAIVSGLYELFEDNSRVLRSLQSVASSLKPGAVLIYTAQPWHPQLEMIAYTLNNHRQQPWMMRPRPQAEMDGLVRLVGLEKQATLIGLEGIFTVSRARKP